MKIALITLFPEMFAALTDHGISGRAVKQGLLEITSYNPRDFTEDRHETVDDRPYGGGPGMVMMIEPLRRAISAAREWTDLRQDVLRPGHVPQVDRQAREGICLCPGRESGVAIPAINRLR